jgi:hypothetical protein
MRLLAASLAALCTITGAASSPQSPSRQSPRPGLYDANPNHLWNRIHGHFHVRVAESGGEHGFDTVDPLLWRETRYLLSGPSHVRAVSLLDEFLASAGERLVSDPLKRAVFQHDLWAIFDWLASVSEGEPKGRQALMSRVARVMRRVALTRKQIEALPDTYAAAVASGAFADRPDPAQPPAFLPRDLFDPKGRWIGIGGIRTVVPQHATELGRSAFIVLWSLPGGSVETAAYLKKLWDFPQPFVSDDAFQFARDGEVRGRLNRALPPVPDGTRIALVRKMMLIDDSGVIVPSNVVQTVQLRVFPGRQGFFELKMTRADLLAARAGGLRAVRNDEQDFVTFSAKGMDIFERPGQPGLSRLPTVLAGCLNCHHVEFEPATETIQSLRHMLKPSSLADSRHDRWARFFPQTLIAAEAKSRTYEWGVLQGLWQSLPR